jgi:acyl-ACP thioesterase
LTDDAFVPPPVDGRVFRHPVTAGLADVAPSGRVRLDAIARWLQDAALADVVDSGLDGGGVWVLRRLRLRVARFPRFGDALEVATFCSGTGALVAERRSTVRLGGVAGDPDGRPGGEAAVDPDGRPGGEAAVEALALWVHLDPDGAHPRPLPEGFDAVYGAAAAGRRVRARLRHPAKPPGGAPGRPWQFRAADLDLAGHVNNSVYWQVLEEDLVAADPVAGVDAEIEHRAAGEAGDAVIFSGDDGMRWISSGDEVLATVRLSDAGGG